MSIQLTPMWRKYALRPWCCAPMLPLRWAATEQSARASSWASSRIRPRLIIGQKNDKSISKFPRLENFRIFTPYSTNLAVVYMQLWVEVRGNYLRNLVFGYFPVSINNKRTGFSAVSLRILRNEINPFWDLWNALRAWNLPTASEMPAGMRGFISFHIEQSEIFHNMR